VEIPLENTVILRSPVSTRNTIQENLARILVGKYSDPDFGNLEAKGYFNFSPPLQKAVLENTAVFESLHLQLKFDYYSYGMMDSSNLQLKVYELLTGLGTDGDFFNTSSIPASGTSIGDTTFSPGPVQLQDGWNRYIDADASNNIYFTLRIQLLGALGQNLFDDVKNNPALLNNFADFITKYPGLSVTMPVGNKILGITPVYSLPYPDVVDSKLVLTYKDGASAFTADFPIFFSNSLTGIVPVMSFSSITADRSSTTLNGVIPYQDFISSDDKLYVQCGSGIVTKLDLGNYYKYFDSLSNVVINSAELVMTNTSQARPPLKIELRILNADNKFRSIFYDTLINGQNVRINDPYLVKIRSSISVSGTSATETSVSILNQISGVLINVNQTTRQPDAPIVTEFFQQIINHRTDPRRAKSFVIFPLDDEFKKTTSSMVLNPSSATLRVYYSKPTNLLH